MAHLCLAAAGGMQHGGQSRGCLAAVLVSHQLHAGVVPQPPVQLLQVGTPQRSHLLTAARPRAACDPSQGARLYHDLSCWQHGTRACAEVPNGVERSFTFLQSTVQALPLDDGIRHAVLARPLGAARRPVLGQHRPALRSLQGVLREAAAPVLVVRQLSRLLSQLRVCQLRVFAPHLDSSCVDLRSHGLILVANRAAA